jgi:hypothetical protein
MVRFSHLVRAGLVLSHCFSPAFALASLAVVFKAVLDLSSAGVAKATVQRLTSAQT